MKDRPTHPLPEREENDLIARARRDPEAFAALYRATYDRVAGYVFRRTGDAHVTEEIVSDVYFQALRGLERYEHRGRPFLGWLLAIAGNAFLHHLRGQRRRQDHELRATRPTVTEEEAERAEAQEALLDLPPEQQEVLALHHMEGLAVAEVAELLGLSDGTVKSRLHRGREALRKRLKKART